MELGTLMRLIVLLFALGLALAGCTEASEPASAPAGEAGEPVPTDACTQQARALGFIVQAQRPARRDFYGNTVVPLLVQWGNSAVDVDCHIDSQGGVTIE